MDDAAADPGIAMSFPDALEKGIGLKLQPVKRPVPVMPIDHVEMPTEN
jgi:uncharacterized protein (TIGR03435 family)